MIGQAKSGYLVGQMLIAMPQMEDQRFSHSVIYLCAHTADGAMGLIVNRVIDALTFPDLLTQLGVDPTPKCEMIRVHFGGPVESARGFVLHSDDYRQESTMVVEGGVALTATLDVLKDIAQGIGPRRSLLALGYAGWGPGQLEEEIRQNAWLNAPADEGLVFGEAHDQKWDQALSKLGISQATLSGDAGHA